MKKDVYYFHIYLVGGRHVSYYDLSHSEAFVIKAKIDKAERDSFIELPTDSKDKLMSILRANITYFECFIKEESNDS